MIQIKNKLSINKMAQAGCLLMNIFDELTSLVRPGISTLEIDMWLERRLKDKGLVSKTKGYMGYKHVCCISVNDEVVHGVPEASKMLKLGYLVKIDNCVAWKGSCAVMS